MTENMTINMLCENGNMVVKEWLKNSQNDHIQEDNHKDLIQEDNHNDLIQKDNHNDLIQENNHNDLMQGNNHNDSIQGENKDNIIIERQEDISLTILDGTFYTIARKQNKKIGAMCTTCKKIINGDLQSSSNYVRHLKTCHTTTYDQYLMHKNNKSKRRFRGQTTLTSNSKFSKEKFDKILQRFVINGLHAVSIVDEPHFIKMVKELNKNVNVISSRTLENRINGTFADYQITLKETIKDEILVTTCDVFSIKHRNYLGMTCHFIKNDYTRASYAIALRRFKWDYHNYDKLFELIDDIHVQYNIQNSVVATVTHNGNNFTKAFKEFGISEETLEICNDNDTEDNTSTTIQPIEIIDDIPYKLPRYIQCACHTINLVLTTDLMNAIKKNPHLSQIHQTTIEKCTFYWDSINRVKSHEIVISILKNQLVFPMKTRWNSLFDSFKSILTHQNELAELSKSLYLPAFEEFELNYLDIYVKSTAPLARAIDLLQGDVQAYYGDLAPVLFSIIKKIKVSHLINDRDHLFIIDCLQKSLIKRFKPIFDFDDTYVILAAASHPKHKARWVDDEGNKKMIHTLLTIEASKIANSFPGFQQHQTRNEETLEEDFFCYYNNPTANDNTRVDLEIINYLKDPSSEINSLERYNLIKPIFLKFNTIIPSSAPVERFFNFANLVGRPNWQRLDDELYERLLLLKNE